MVKLLILSLYSVTVKQESTPDGVVAQLQISSAEASDSGAYFCQASNLYGRDQQLVQLLVQGCYIAFSSSPPFFMYSRVRDRRPRNFYTPPNFSAPRRHILLNFIISGGEKKKNHQKFRSVYITFVRSNFFFL